MMLYPPEGDPQVVQKFQLEQRSAERLLMREFSAGALAVVIPLSDINQRISLRCLHADSYGGLEFFVPKGVEIPFAVRQQTDFAVAISNDQHKVQFFVSNMRFVSTERVTCDFPTKVSAIQRRENYRVPAPFDGSLGIVIAGLVGNPDMIRVRNIGFHGLALDFKEAMPIPVETIWSDCRFAKGELTSEPFMLQVKYVFFDSNDFHSFRTGCELLAPTEQNLKDFETTRDSIHNARVAGWAQRWPADVSWLR